MLYLDEENNILCPQCANAYIDADDERERPVAPFIFYEGDPECCAVCFTIVTSAYGS
jgi:hypothetical protein